MFNHVATARMRSAPSDHGHGFDGGGFDGGGFDGGGPVGIGFGGLLADASVPGAHGFEVQVAAAQGPGVQGWGEVQDGHTQVIQAETVATVIQAHDGAPVDPRTGPMSNGHAQGQCFSDVVTGVYRALDPDYFTGHVLTGLIRGISPQVMLAELGLHATLTAGNSAVDAFKNSPACQALDNAAEANRLGLGAIGAP